MFDSWHDVSWKFADWCLILEQLSGGSCGSLDDEIWEWIRICDQCPHFGNVRQAVVLMKLECKIQRLYPSAEVSYFVNALDSHLYIDGVSIANTADFDSAIALYLHQEEAASLKNIVSMIQNQPKSGGYFVKSCKIIGLIFGKIRVQTIF